MEKCRNIKRGLKRVRSSYIPVNFSPKVPVNLVRSTIIPTCNKLRNNYGSFETEVYYWRERSKFSSMNWNSTLTDAMGKKLKITCIFNSWNVRVSGFVHDVCVQRKKMHSNAGSPNTERFARIIHVSKCVPCKVVFTNACTLRLMS